MWERFLNNVFCHGTTVLWIFSSWEASRDKRLKYNTTGKSWRRSCCIKIAQFISKDSNQLHSCIFWKLDCKSKRTDKLQCPYVKWSCRYIQVDPWYTLKTESWFHCLHKLLNNVHMLLYRKRFLFHSAVVVAKPNPRLCKESELVGQDRVVLCVIYASYHLIGSC